MINLRNAKDMKVKVNEIIKKRKPIKLTKKQKETRKKFGIFIAKLVLAEYIVFSLFVAITYVKHLTDESIKKDKLIEKQQQIIYMLSEKHQDCLQTERTEVVSRGAIVDRTTEPSTYLGKFKLTHYCACAKCCGPNAQGITASGKRVEENKTIAVDPKVIPLGTKVIINGQEYEAQDTGSAIKGNIIDIYVADHQEALKLGVKYADVYQIGG